MFDSTLRDALLRSARECRHTRGAIAALAPQLPDDEGGLDRLLAEIVTARDQQSFSPIFFAALHAGRQPNARHLIDGGALLPDAKWLAAAGWFAAGDIGEALLTSVRRGQMGVEREGIALLIAGLWCQRKQRPLTAGLTAEARVLARRARSNYFCMELLMALGDSLQDDSLVSLVKELSSTVELAIARTLRDSLLEQAGTSPLDHLPEAIDRTIAAGFTMRRAVERVGRNDPCPCGSGQKYKRCCLEKDQQRLQHSSAVAGLTQDEFLAERERFLTEDDIATMRSYEVAKLDPVKVPPDLQGEVIDRLLTFNDLDRAVGFLEKVGFRPDLEFAWDMTVHGARERWRADLLRRLLALPPAEPPPRVLLEFDVQLLLTDDPARHLSMICEEVLAGLQMEGQPRPSKLVGVAYALLDSPYRALGIVFARGILAKINPLEAMTVVESLLEKRDQLELPAHDPAEEMVDQMFGVPPVRPAVETPDSNESSEARRRLEEKAGEVEKLKAALNQLQHEVNRRQSPLPPSAATPPAAPSSEPRPSEDAGLRELRRKMEELKASLKERHQERNQLRRELLEARGALESLRESQAATPAPVEASEDNEDALCEHEEEFAQQPPRIAEFPRKFSSDLRALPRTVARATLVLIGRLSAGEPAAFSGVKRLHADRELLRQRVAGDYRLLFRLHADVLQVVDLVHRRDLDRRLKSLG